MTENEAAWSGLLEKLLIRIFEHLTAEDLKEVGLTCKHWLEVSSRPIFLRRLKVFVYNKERREQFPGKTKVPSVLELMAGSSRNFVNFQCERVKLDGKNGDAFWPKFAPVITHLALVKCQIASHYFVQLLQKMPNLCCIDFCDMDYSTKWRPQDFDCLKGKWNIQHLNWAAMNQITEVMFNAIFGMANSTLETLRLTAISANADTDPEYHQNANQLLKVKTFQSFLLQHRNNLKSVDLAERGPYQFTIKVLLKVTSLTLTKVTLVSYPADKNCVDLNAFMWSQKQLQDIYLMNVPTDNETLWAISEMADIKDLSIAQGARGTVNDEGLELLRTLKKVENLTLNNFSDVTTKGFNKLFEELDVSKLDYLNLIRFVQLEGTSFHEVLPRMTNLTALIIENCNRLVDDKVLMAIFESLVKLKTLTLEDLPNVSKAGFFGHYGISNLRQLNLFSLTMCPTFCDDCLCNIDGLPALNFVALVQCPKVTKAGVRGFLRNFSGFEQKRRAGREGETAVFFEKKRQAGLKSAPIGFRFTL